MRERKFRVWDNADKRMITHGQAFIPLKVTNLGVLRLDPCIEEDRWEIINGDRFKLMQYTGLNENHGNEIYEEDIVKIYNHKYIIKFEIGSFMLVRCSDETDMYDQFEDCWNDDVYPLAQFYWNSDSEEDILGNCEVIGNKYENPELLGE